jgi:acetyl esterase/lipase
MIRTAKFIYGLMPFIYFLSQPSSAAPARKSKLRILCLHGFHGSGAILSRQMGSLRATLEQHADLVFVDAPSLKDGKFGWWHAVQSRDSTDVEDPGVVGTISTHYEGWQETRTWLIDVFAKQGPFDGVLGFSQGAALTGLATALRAPDHKPSIEQPLSFRFAIEFSGFPARDPKLAELYSREKSFDLPSLHFVGKTDSIVPPDKTLALAKIFKNPQIFDHADGHIIPTTDAAKKTISDFLTQAKSLKAASLAASSARRNPLSIPLWANRERPTMTLYFPKGNAESRPAILVLPGGAYATDSGSGSDAAAWIAEQGYVGIKVEYATQGTREKFPANYEDAARAVRLVRQKASEWGIDPEKIGLMGFSAGGHLAALVATQPDLSTTRRDDLLEKYSAKPNLLILGYPLISFVDGYYPGAYASSVDHFFGSTPVPETKRQEFSSELHVTENTPPTFLWTTDDDSIVPSNHSKLFVKALESAKVPVKFNLYPHGRHGLGLARNEGVPVANWTKDLLLWLKQYWP